MVEILGIITEDFVNYKKPSMIIEFPRCSFKCGADKCQNYKLIKERVLSVDEEELIRKYYYENHLTGAILFQGLEPFDSWVDLCKLMRAIRKYTDDEVVIWTGYEHSEISDYIKYLQKFPNIIVKFGRYRPELPQRYDDILGVTLASDNQYAIRIS